MHPATTPPAPQPANSSTLRKDLRAIYADGVAWALMVGLGETFFAAYVLAAGGREVWAGLIVTLPMVLGAILQLAGPWGVRKLGSHRSWVVLTAALQTAAFLPLIAGAIAGHMPIWLAYVAVTLYFAGGMGAGAPWVTLVGAIVPGQIRANYFARRTRALHAGTLIGLLIGGAVLQMREGDDDPLSGFIILFSLAFACRAVSTWFLSRYSDPPIPMSERTLIGPRQVLARLRPASPGADGGSDLRILAYMLGVQVTVQISSPFFTPFMLGQLKFSPAEFMLLIGATAGAKMLALPLLGSIAKRHGPMRVLWIGGLGIIPMSSLWIVSDAFAYLLVLQATSGIMWAAYELSTFLLLYERIHERDRTAVMTLFNLANALSIALGSLLGGLLLLTLKATGDHQHAYHTLFILSTALRLSTVVLLIRITRQRPITSVSAGTEAIEVRTAFESFDRPSVPSLPEEPPPAPQSAPPPRGRKRRRRLRRDTR